MHLRIPESGPNYSGIDPLIAYGWVAEYPLAPPGTRAVYLTPRGLRYCSRQADIIGSFVPTGDFRRPSDSEPAVGTPTADPAPANSAGQAATH